MNILTVTTEFPPETGGIGLYVYELCHALQGEFGHRVSVLATDKPGSRAFDAEAPLPVLRRGSDALRYAKLLPLLCGAYGLCRRGDIEHVLAGSWQYAGVVGRVVPGLARCSLFGHRARLGGNALSPLCAGARGHGPGFSRCGHCVHSG